MNKQPQWTSVSTLLVACTGLACGGGNLGAVGDEPDFVNEPSDSSEQEQMDGAADPGTAGDDTRIVRLSHIQYDNTVRQLLGVEQSSADSFAPDSLNGFAFDTASNLEVDPRLGPQYRRAAEQLAEGVVADSGLYQQLLPCEPSAAGCAQDFIEAFGERAFRRPMTTAEAGRFLTLFDSGAELISSGDGFRDGVQITVEALLQSPQFLYRTETSEAEVINGRAALNDWEVASRLSFFLLDSMPDDELFLAARNGQLNTSAQVAGAAERLLEQPRAAEKLLAFHQQVWQFDRIGSITPSADAYPEAPDDIVSRVRRSASRFVQSVIEDGGGLYEFLNAPYAFVDEPMAPLFGVNVNTGDELQRVEFDPSERKGFLMQPGYLAANSYSAKPDSIHRGLFVIRNLLCRNIPEPPPGAQGTPPPETDEPIVTNRDEVALLTSRNECQGCHFQINPPGFAFEGFDAVGQIRTEDNGAPVDTTGTMLLDGEAVDFDGPHQLVEALGRSREAQACYATRWLEFAKGRELVSDDLDLVTLRDEIADRQLSVTEIVKAVVSADSFITRDANEVSP